jgi:hypothetical protein
VRFELTDQTCLSLDEYLRPTGKKSGQFLFTGRDPARGLTTRQYARLVGEREEPKRERGAVQGG